MDTTTQAPLIACNTPKRQRQAAALQRITPRTANPVPREVDALLAFVPDVTPDDNPRSRPPSNVDCREWLRPSMVVTPSKVNGSPAISFGEPPPGLTGLECVLWREMGHACARAALFLFQWLTVRRYLPACEFAGVATHEVTMYREASPTFGALYESVQSAVRTTKVARTEDTIHALANGDTRKVKVTTGPDGEVTTVDDGAIYDVKAASLELAALDPTRYGNAKGVSGAVSVAIQINIPPPPQRVTVERTVSATEEPEEAEYCEA